MDRATYLKELSAAYQGEVRGEATFATLAALASDAGERQIWRMLERLELTTRQRMLPLMQRHGLDTAPDEAQRRRGQERGQARAVQGFAATIRAMPEGLKPFLTLYAQLEAEALPDDRAELSFLNAHEIALDAFAARVLAGSDDPLAPVRSLLDPETPR